MKAIKETKPRVSLLDAHKTAIHGKRVIVRSYLL